MKRDSRGRTYPETREEWDLWEALVREGWRPRPYRQNTPVVYFTCLICEHIYPWNMSQAAGRQICSEWCAAELKVKTRAMYKLMRRLTRIYHHQRVKEWLDERGWRVQQPQVDLRVRRVRQINTTYATHRKWRRDGHTLVCRHPNVKGWLRCYTGPRGSFGMQLRDVHVWIPMVPLDQPFGEPLFNCVARATPGHVRARALLRMTGGQCQCVTCQSVPRIVDMHMYNQLRHEYRYVNSAPPPKWSRIEAPQEAVNAITQENDKWRVHYSREAREARRAARTGQPGPGGAISDIPHHGGDDHRESSGGAEGGGGTGPGPVGGGPVD